MQIIRNYPRVRSEHGFSGRIDCCVPSKSWPVIEPITGTATFPASFVIAAQSIGIFDNFVVTEEVSAK